MSKIYNENLKNSDPEVYVTLERELHRQQNQIELIICFFKSNPA